mmetsp:Transcript_5223/g.21500  ORF Transcript_5223/g.21500 Transcript_5223/m.21500 type:complete len:757 (-) Transcript_5223:140-2410(-)
MRRFSTRTLRSRRRAMCTHVVPTEEARDAASASTSDTSTCGAIVEAVGPSFLGQHKWLGGATTPDGVLVGIPGHARHAVAIDPFEDTVTTVHGPELNRRALNRYKWLRGVARPDGSVLGIPMHADAILEIRTDAARDASSGVTTAAAEARLLAPRLPRDEFKWHGGCLGANGCVYGVPCGASCVLKIDARNAVSFIDVPQQGVPEHVAQTKKAQWYGGIYAPSVEAMYCVPFAATRVLRVDLRADATRFVGPELVQDRDAAKWHGGVLSTDGRTAYMMPAHATAVLAVTVATDEVRLLGDLSSKEGGLADFNGGRYKYGGGCAVGDVVYGIPADARAVLKIEGGGDRVSTFGVLEARKNKWQNGAVGRDGRIYCVPCDSDAVLVIDPQTDALTLVALPTGPGPTEDKFQGGYTDAFGRVWCVPESARRVVCVTPTEVSDAAFVEAYLRRLGLRGAPALEAIVERHVARIPFENLDSHVEKRPRRSVSPLSRVALYEKLLVRHRGGDCFELNCALLYLLEALGAYGSVILVPCRVFAGPERGRPRRPGYRAAPSHFALLVGGTHFVDVGFGEAPIAPLPYFLCPEDPPEVVTTTPEGMRSRIVRAQPPSATTAKLQLEWQPDPDGPWLPRLQWDQDFDATRRPRDLEKDRAFVLAATASSLRRKLVVSRLERDRKLTLAGTTLKVTGPPRFRARVDDPEVPIERTDLGRAAGDDDEALRTAVRGALRDHFGIALRETADLDLRTTRSCAAPDLWSHL